jgi:two-component system, sensor histidine kinase and response regulator
VLGVTAHALARDQAQCMAAGMNDVVIKPFDPNELFAAIARWLPAAVPATSPDAVAATADGAAAVSFELGLSRCLGRHDLYLRVVRRFLDTRRHDGTRLREAHASADSAGLSHLAHTTVSTAGTIGAARLSEIAEHLQEAVRVDARAALPALVDAFALAHQRVVDELEAFVARH